METLWTICGKTVVKLWTHCTETVAKLWKSHPWELRLQLRQGARGNCGPNCQDCDFGALAHSKVIVENVVKAQDDYKADLERNAFHQRVRDMELATTRFYEGLEGEAFTRGLTKEDLHTETFDAICDVMKQCVGVPEDFDVEAIFLFG